MRIKQDGSRKGKTMKQYACPKCGSLLRERDITSKLYAMETRHEPAEYVVTADCHECGWSGDMQDADEVNNADPNTD